MSLTMRRYCSDEDYLRIREFLRDTLLIHEMRQINWDVARFDYWRWHGILNMKDGTLEDDVFIWENEGGEIRAVLNREAPGSVFLQTHPDYRSEVLEDEMLDVAENHLAVDAGTGRTLHVWVGEEDALRRDCLSGRGYCVHPQKRAEHQRWCSLTRPITPAKAADGYTIRALGDKSEHSARCWVSWQAFHPNEPDDLFEDGWYHNIQQAPLYRRDLDLVAVAPDGEFAAFCTIWYDSAARTGLFEPVGTAPQHQRRGLGKAILSEGMIRLRKLGADLAYVGSYGEPAHSLYASVGLETYRIQVPWVRTIRTPA